MVYGQMADDSLSARQQIQEFQQEMNAHFKDTASSPLPDEEELKFKGHDFYPVNLKYRVLASLTLTPDSTPFEMLTTTARRPLYRQYAVVSFIIDDTSHQLALYEPLRQKNDGEENNYLFIPFKDHTNGSETYGGGRYLDISKPDSNVVIIDFNQAYNPYCAYNYKYSCPIPPDQNHLQLRIEAGIKFENY